MKEARTRIKDVDSVEYAFAGKLFSGSSFEKWQI